MPTAPPRAEASPRTHTLTPPCSPSAAAPSLPLYFSDWERPANLSQRRRDVNCEHSTPWYPQIPRESVRFSLKAFPPPPSALGSSASLVLWTEEGKAQPDRCERFPESTTSPNPRPLRARWGWRKARYFGEGGATAPLGRRARGLADALPGSARPGGVAGLCK